VYCDECGKRRAAILQRHTGRRLCRECFIEDVRSRVSTEISRWDMIREGERVLLALSGGKDSFVLLDTLSSMVDPSRLIALSIVEGIPGYNRLDDILKMRKYASERGVDLIITSMKDYVGYSLSEIVDRARAKGVGVSACTYCGMIRRRMLNYIARELGADKLATAHNLDDEAQTVLVNIMRGDIVGLLRSHPMTPPASSRLVGRIKPLRKVYEWENSTYAYVKGFRFQEVECRYITSSPTLRARIRKVLQRIEMESPGTLLRVLNVIDGLLEEHARGSETDILGSCSVCGEPTTRGRGLCKVCELLGRAGIKRPNYVMVSGGIEG